MSSHLVSEVWNLTHLPIRREWLKPQICQRWPNSWMVYNGKSPSQKDDNGYGTPMNWNPPLYKIYQKYQPTNSSNHLIQAALAEFKSLNGGMAMNVSMASSKGKQWTGDEWRKKDVLRSSLPAMSNIPKYSKSIQFQRIFINLINLKLKHKPQNHRTFDFSLQNLQNQRATEKGTWKNLIYDSYNSITLVL